VSEVADTVAADTGRSAAQRPASQRLPALIRALRPLQWTKNALVLAPVLFGKEVFEFESLLRAVAAVLAFCAVSSGIYLLNDLRDIEQDRLHPRKRSRPIAAGELDPRTALVTAGALLLAGLAIAALVRPGFVLVIAGYAALMVAYSYRLKQIVIVDVFAIAAGFVLRAAGGAIAIGVPISPWLYFCTMLGALFLGFGKRRNELLVLQRLAASHRANLDAYSVQLLDQIIAIVSAAIVMAYSLYTFDAATAPSNHAMMLTIPFVLYGLFRYLYLVYRRELGGSPETILVTDKPLVACIACWAATSLLILYLN
jgi:4-hydroxybenzoate polyprenyltransferase